MGVLLRSQTIDNTVIHGRKYLSREEIDSMGSPVSLEVLCTDFRHYYVDYIVKDSSRMKLHFPKWKKSYDISAEKEFLDNLYLAPRGTFSVAEGIRPQSNTYPVETAVKRPQPSKRVAKRKSREESQVYKDEDIRKPFTNLRRRPRSSSMDESIISDGTDSASGGCDGYDGVAEEGVLESLNGNTQSFIANIRRIVKEADYDLPCLHDVKQSLSAVNDKIYIGRGLCLDLEKQMERCRQEIHDMESEIRSNSEELNKYTSEYNNLLDVRSNISAKNNGVVEAEGMNKVLSTTNTCIDDTKRKIDKLEYSISDMRKKILVNTESLKTLEVDYDSAVKDVDIDIKEKEKLVQSDSVKTAVDYALKRLRPHIIGLLLEDGPGVS